MKQAVIILLLTIAVFDVKAQSVLKVRLTDASPMNVAVDGRYFNKRGTSITVGDLPEGRHFVQIYVMSYRTRRQRIIYEGRVNTRDGMATLLQYNPYSRRMEMYDEEITANANRRQHYYDEKQDNGSTMEPPPVNDYDASAVSPASPVASPAISGTLTESKVARLQKDVAAKKTDTEKMNLLKDELKDETMTTHQVGVVMDWFGFENTKVDFAEWAYPNAVDKEAYPDLDAKLTYKGYQDDFNKFLKSKQ